jgi:glutathionylspermidine synthase
MNISDFNKGIYDSISSDIWRKYWDTLVAEFKEMNEQYVAKEDGHLIDNYPMPVFIPLETYLKLIEASEILIEVQFRILKDLLKKHSPKEILKMFYIPSYLERFIDWKKIATNPPSLGRMDIIFVDGIRPVFCEFNIDSSIGGGDAFLYIEHAKSRFPDMFPEGCRLDSFYNSLSDYAIKFALELGKKGIGLFFWNDWLDKGLYNSKYLMDHVKARNFMIEKISDVDLKTGKKTMEDKLMYRAFVKEHMIDDLDFIDDLFKKGMVLISDFGDEIYCSKIWFGLLYDENMTSGLSQKEKETIGRYIPRTVIVSEDNIDDLIRKKDEWIFKPVDSFGGKGIMIGEEVVSDEIINAISYKSRKWIAQEYIKDSSMLLPKGNNRQYEKYNAVFGLYKAGKEYSGLLLRLSQVTKIVNVTGGKSLISWAVPV